MSSYSMRRKVIFLILGICIYSFAKGQIKYVTLSNEFKDPPGTIVTSPDGLKWLIASARMWNDPWTFTVLMDFTPLFTDSAQGKPVSKTLRRLAGEFLVSPNLKYYGGTKVLSSSNERSSSQVADKYLTQIEAVPAEKVTEKGRQYNDRHYTLAILDDGRLITTDPSIDKSAKTKVFYTSAYKNLYLTDAEANQKIKLYDGVVAEIKNHFDNAPNRFLSTDNKKFIIQNNYKFYISDLVLHHTTSLELPAAENGLELLIPRVFRQVGDSILWTAGIAEKNRDARQRYPYVCIMNIRTGKKASIKILPDMGDDRSFTLHPLGENLVVFNRDTRKLTTITIEGPAITEGEPVTLETVSKNNPFEQNPQTLFTYTPGGIMFVVVSPDAPDGSSHPFYMFDASTGKLAYGIVAYRGSRDAPVAYKPPPPMSKEDCAKYTDQAKKWEGWAVKLADGKLHHIVGFDCNKQVYVLAREEKGMTRASEDDKQQGFLYFNYAVFSTMFPADLELRGKEITQQKLCPACNGDPVYTEKTTRSGWSWKPVLGLTWFVMGTKREVKNQNYVCNVCQGKAFIKK